MYLLEITENPKLSKAIVAIDKLRDALDSKEITANWTLDTLLKYFEKFDLILSPEDLYDMIKTKPLKDVISNIQGDEVIFKGLPQKEKHKDAPPPEETKKTIKKMAKHAMKKKK